MALFFNFLGDRCLDVFEFVEQLLQIIALHRVDQTVGDGSCLAHARLLEDDLDLPEVLAVLHLKVGVAILRVYVDLALLDEVDLLRKLSIHIEYFSFLDHGLLKQLDEGPHELRVVATLPEELDAAQKPLKLVLQDLVPQSDGQLLDELLLIIAGEELDVVVLEELPDLVVHLVWHVGLLRELLQGLKLVLYFFEKHSLNYEEVLGVGAFVRDHRGQVADDHGVEAAPVAHPEDAHNELCVGVGTEFSIAHCGKGL